MARWVKWRAPNCPKKEKMARWVKWGGPNSLKKEKSAHLTEKTLINCTAMYQKQALYKIE